MGLSEFWKVVGDGIVKGDDAVRYRDADERRRKRLRNRERSLSRVTVVPIEVVLVKQAVTLHDNERSRLGGTEKRFQVIMAAR